MALELIDSYPWFLNKPLPLAVNEQIIKTRITATEWVEHWRPFLARLLVMYQASRPRRFIVGIAGPPGAGKSVFAEQLNWMVGKGFLAKDAHSMSLPMDGFHYPNAYLLSHTRKLADGTEIPLSSVKGQPDTFDIASMRKALKELAARPEYVEWPGYTRVTHEPIPGKIKIHSSINIVFVEGNYLLVDRGAFAGIPGIFDLRIYIDGPAPKILSNLMERHIKGGKSVQDAKDWVKRIDLPNARVAESTKVNADVIIERNHEDDLSLVLWREDIDKHAAAKAAGAAAVQGAKHGSAAGNVAIPGAEPAPKNVPPAG